jgi:branched-chain amino acid transport system ATP-binding protein
MLDRAASGTMLSVKQLQSWYGESHILHGVDLEIQKREVVTLLGRNGAGKTTTLKSIMGIVGKRTGSVSKDGRETIGLTSDRIARLGIAFCPEERGIFASLSVRENLMLPPALRAGGLSVEEIFELFPNLKERLSTSQGTKLSGGEQQMLAIGRILRTGADLLLLDEPTEGLAPVIIQEIGRTIRKLKERGLTILLVEQNASTSWSTAASSTGSRAPTSKPTCPSCTNTWAFRHSPNEGLAKPRRRAQFLTGQTCSTFSEFLRKRCLDSCYSDSSTGPSTPSSASGWPSSSAC